MERETTCCFTGHRPNKLPWGEDETDRRCLELKEAIRRAVEKAYDRGYRHFICGMARGCDLYFCEAVQALRDARPGVTVEAAIPCETQADKWPEGERERYNRSSTTTTGAVCSAGTGTWWTIPLSSSPPWTAARGERCIPPPTP